MYKCTGIGQKIFGPGFIRILPVPVTKQGCEEVSYSTFLSVQKLTVCIRLGVLVLFLSFGVPLC